MKTKKWTVLLAFLLILCLAFTSCTTDEPINSASKDASAGNPDSTQSPGQSDADNNQAAAKADGVKMIVSVDSGKALASDNGSVTTSTYTFLAVQTWQEEKDGEATLYKNVVTGKYLTATDAGVTQADKSGDASQKWEVTLRPDTFSTIKSVANNKVLASANGALTLKDASEEVSDFWMITEVYDKAPNKGDTSWMSGKYGVMAHLLVNSSNLRSVNNKFDAEGVAAQLNEIGASYYMLTLGQGGGFYLTENAAFATITGKGKRFTEDDLITKMANALKQYDIKLIVYIPGMPSMGDYADNATFGFRKVNNSYVYDDNSVMKWSMVLREWSNKYGDLVDGWWLEACSMSIGFTDEMAYIYANAIKSGNPNAAVAFNQGQNDDLYAAEDFTAGETAAGIPVGEINRKETWLLPDNGGKTQDGKQWFILTPFGKNWLSAGLAYDAQTWGAYLKEIKAVGGSVALECNINTTTGIITDEVMTAFKAARDIANG